MGNGKRNNNDQSSFILYYDSIRLIEKLSDADAGQLIKAVFDYKVNGTVSELSPAADMAFTAIRNYLDRDAASYQTKCLKNAENGRKGGLATQERARQQNQANQANARNASKNQLKSSESSERVANQADSGNESGIDSDSGSDSVFNANHKQPQQTGQKKNSFQNFHERDNDYDAIQNELIKKGMK